MFKEVPRCLFGLALIGNAVLVRVINKSTKYHDLVKTVFQFCLELCHLPTYQISKSGRTKQIKRTGVSNVISSHLRLFSDSNNLAFNKP